MARKGEKEKVSGNEANTSRQIETVGWRSHQQAVLKKRKCWWCLGESCRVAATMQQVLDAACRSEEVPLFRVSFYYY